MNSTKTYIKSPNNVSKIYTRYTLALIIYTILLLTINLILHNSVIPLIKSLLISLIVTTILSYIINIFKHKYNFLELYTEDHIELIAIIIALFGINTNIYVLFSAIFLSVMIRSIIKNISISSSLYGILIILTYKYLTNNLAIPLTLIKELSNSSIKEIIKLGPNLINYLFAIDYLAPALVLLAFIYLFYRKSIKYNIFLSYIVTIFIMSLTIGIINDYAIWFPIFELFTCYTLILSVFILTDYKNTPLTNEGMIIYGIILAIITMILKFIIPAFSIVIPMLIGPILLTSWINKISPKLKYNQKLYYQIIIISLIISIIISIVLTKLSIFR